MYLRKIGVATRQARSDPRQLQASTHKLSRGISVRMHSQNFRACSPVQPRLVPIHQQEEGPFNVLYNRFQEVGCRRSVDHTVIMSQA